MAGMLLHYLVLEQLAPLRHVHITAWCDNTPTISWTNKLSTSQSLIAGQLTRALTMRIHINEASHLTSLSIAGIDNTIDDTASRTFHCNTATELTFTIPDDEFVLTFNSSFPLQNCSWQGFRLSNRLVSRVYSKLKGGEASMLASWQRLTKKGSTTGTIGNDSSNPSVTWIPNSPLSPPTTTSNYSQPSLSMSTLAPAAKATEYVQALSKSQSVPLARCLNWTDSPTLHTALKDATGYNSKDS